MRAMARAAKTRVVVQLPRDLVADARIRKLDVSAICARALARAIGNRTDLAAWLSDNEEAITAYNRHVAKHGTFAEQLGRTRRTPKKRSRR